MSYHYVYELEDCETHIKYIGLRTSKVQPEQDTYMSSSKIIKKLLRIQRKFTKTILSTWSSRLEAAQEESRLHVLYDVGRNPNFYNLTCSPQKAVHGGVLKGRTYNEIHGEIKALKLRKTKSDGQKGRIFTPEHKQKLRENHANVAGRNNPRSQKGSLFTKDGIQLTTFDTKIELKAWCRDHIIPHRVLIKTGHYDPLPGSRNKQFEHLRGMYIIYDS